ncbi:hypothetical protein CTRI78_v002688 [Colletotrichum trifolii]|uniref:Uncharacterized protein n=1 Tax=Colletotrichum trifolii TaxID=5466 RepID=A0A4R8RL64_COLTR|nr:hypothetical protein CTRI78_v002688 [Colletotrichum trifolii]
MASSGTSSPVIVAGGSSSAGAGINFINPAAQTPEQAAEEDAMDISQDASESNDQPASSQATGPTKACSKCHEQRPLSEFRLTTLKGHIKHLIHCSECRSKRRDSDKRKKEAREQEERELRERIIEQQQQQQQKKQKQKQNQQQKKQQKQAGPAGIIARAPAGLSRPKTAASGHDASVFAPDGSSPANAASSAGPSAARRVRFSVGRASSSGRVGHASAAGPASVDPSAVAGPSVAASSASRAETPVHAPTDINPHDPHRTGLDKISVIGSVIPVPEKDINVRMREEKERFYNARHTCPWMMFQSDETINGLWQKRGAAIYLGLRQVPLPSVQPFIGQSYVNGSHGLIANAYNHPDKA